MRRTPEYYKSITPEAAKQIEARYVACDLDTSLDEFVHHEIGEEQVEPLIFGYTDGVADLAIVDSDDIEVPIVRAGFARLTEGYNTALRKREFGSSKLARIALKLSYGKELPMYVLERDDKFWNEQFMDEYQQQRDVSEIFRDGERSHFRKYVRSVAHGYSFSYFTLSV